MRPTPVRRLMPAIVLSMLCMRGLANDRGTPWWDRLSTFVQTPDAGQAADLGASASLCGASDDAAWGIWGQRLRTMDMGRRAADAFHARGVKALSWIEGFGTPSCYVVQLRKDAAGAWRKYPGTDVTQAFLNSWGWQEFDGTGEVRWLGLHNYWGDEDFARPYTLRHPRYGTPPPRYPDGRVAEGYAGPATDPRTHRGYDATCAKDVRGRAWGADRSVTLITDALRGASTTSSGRPADVPTVVPDPGYTPAQWAERTRRTGAALHIAAGKDAACPHWIDYVRAETRLALDTGCDGFWIDNFSPWDSLNAAPVHHAFGDWSVATFRRHLAAGFSVSRLRAMGVPDAASFDVRAYMQRRVKAWGGDPRDLKDPRWADARWRDDPVWRAYLIHKRRTGTQALSRMYRAIKQEAARAGKPDFLVMGNDTPAFSLGWPRGDLDMVSTELTWGWWLATGPRGLMPPPYGSYVPVYKLAREHARGRFVNTWPYAADEAKGKPNIARVIHWQGLANHTLPMPQMTDHTLGTNDVTREFNAFVHRAAAEFAGRTPVEEVGLYYSSSSELADLAPAFYLHHDAQPHAFSFWGWGTALTWLHVPWRAVPEWKLRPDVLRSLRVLVVPNAEVFPTEDVPALARWVRAGGRLLVSGRCGTRVGESGNFDPAGPGGTLAALTGSRPGVTRAVGRGRVLWVADDAGLPFYQASDKRPDMLAGMASRLRQAGAPAFTVRAPGVSWKVGLTPYRTARGLTVDVNNTDIDLARDAVTPSAPCSFEVVLPPSLRGRSLRAHVVSPDVPAPRVKVTPGPGGRARIEVGPVQVYAAVVIERR